MTETESKKDEDSCKIVVIGDGDVGKTSLLIQFTDDRFEDVYIPTIFDNREIKMEVDNRIVNLNLWDTAGQEEFAQLRSLSYPDCDVFILCFALDRPSSLQNVKNKWWPEVLNHKPSTPIILVGTKLDLVSDQSNLQTKKRHSLISKEAETTAKEMHATTYVECSAREKINCSKSFEMAVRAALYPATIKKKKRKACEIL